MEARLFRAQTFFEDIPLHTITTQTVTEWMERLQRDPGPTKREVELELETEHAGLSPSQVTQHLGALGQLLKYARGAGLVPSGFDPIKDVVGRPQGSLKAVTWLEPTQALDFIREADKEHIGELARVLLYTGLRSKECRGLTVGDVDLVADEIHLRKNAHRRLKTRTSSRDIPIWPDLRPTLETLVRGRAPDALLLSDGETLSSNVPVLAWRRAAKAADVPALTPHGCRHTYISQRLCCLDGGHPVSPFTVMKEVGHSDLKLIETRYGHSAKKRVRIEGFGYALPSEKGTSRVQVTKRRRSRAVA